jgi:hypothetical protein
LVFRFDAQNNRATLTEQWGETLTFPAKGPQSFFNEIAKSRETKTACARSVSDVKDLLYCAAALL